MTILCCEEPHWFEKQLHHSDIIKKNAWHFHKQHISLWIDNQTYTNCVCNPTGWHIFYSNKVELIQNPLNVSFFFHIV